MNIGTTMADVQVMFAQHARDIHHLRSENVKLWRTIEGLKMKMNMTQHASREVEAPIDISVPSNALSKSARRRARRELHRRHLQSEDGKRTKEDEDDIPVLLLCEKDCSFLSRSNFESNFESND